VSWVYCKRWTSVPGWCLRVTVATMVAMMMTAIMSLTLTGCDRESREVSSVPMAQGQEPYLRFCASCHGNQGQGRPPAFPPIAGSEWMALPPEAHALIILYGLRGEIEVSGRTYRGLMPPMQHMSDQDIADVLVFIDSQWGEHLAQGEPMLDAEDIAALRGALPGQRQPLYRLQGVLDAVEALP